MHWKLNLNAALFKLNAAQKDEIQDLAPIRPAKAGILE